MSAFGFDQSGSGRVVDAVRRVESGFISPSSPRGNGRDNPYLVWVKITAQTVADSPAKNRWTYTVTQVNKTAAGYDGWTLVTDSALGIVGGTAYNFIEQMNVAADASSPTIMGNGIDIDSATFLATTFAVMPAPINLIVPAWVVLIQVNETTQTRELWFAWENSVDGAC